MKPLNMGFNVRVAVSLQPRPWFNMNLQTMLRIRDPRTLLNINTVVFKLVLERSVSAIAAHQKDPRIFIALNRHFIGSSGDTLNGFLTVKS
jgi:hypothetical protein